MSQRSGDLGKCKIVKQYTNFLPNVPPEDYFWDLVHLYDEANMVLAEQINSDIRHWIEAALASNNGF